jgi:uncharacterized protein YbjT (DUF2867 family)
VDDIGWFGARAFTDAAALNGREIDLAGDLRTMPEAAEILTEALGRPIAFAQTPIEQVREYSKDMDSNPGPPACEERSGLPRILRGRLFCIGWIGSGSLLPLTADGRNANFRHSFQHI